MVDATTQAALEATIVNRRYLLYAEFEGDELRATSGIYDKTISGSGDSELDGTYQSVDPNLVSVNSINHNEKGSDPFVISLNGILSGTEYIQDRAESFIQDRDNDYIRIRGSSLLNILGDTTRWEGNLARVWSYQVDENEVQVGLIIEEYTGFMNDIKISGAPDRQIVTMSIENYMMSISGAGGKTLMNQSEYDSGDNSAAATLGAANGLGGGVISGAGGGGGGAGTDTDTTRRQLL